MILTMAQGYGLAQETYPVLKSNAVTTYIVEDGKDTIAWILDPSLKPDVYILTKTIKKRRIDFVSDVQCVSFAMTPGTQKEVLVLYGKDSCITRFVCPPLISHQDQIPEVHDTIPFILTAYNNLVIPVVVDGKDTLALKFDTGSTGFRLTKTTLDAAPWLGKGSKHTLQLGRIQIKNQHFIPVAVSGQETVGRFGWDVWDGYIVELDYDQNRMIIHSRLKAVPPGYKAFPLEYGGGLPVMKATLRQGRNSFSGSMLLDNGYQKALFLDQQTADAWELPLESMEVLNNSVLLNGAGDTIKVRTLKLEAFSAGQLKLLNVPLQITNAENPSGMHVAIIGNELLKRFNMILDFQRHRVHLRANQWEHEPYADLKIKN
jgi:hypothetical protein